MVNTSWFFFKWGVAACTLLALLAIASQAAGQQSTLPLQDLAAFRNPGKSWQVAGNVMADLAMDNKLETSAGSGILVNIPGKKVPGQDLFTNFEHGDLDLELEYLMAKGSNSGIYLQGRYELQLTDNWGTAGVSAGSNGGIYERWDDSRPQGQQGYEGYAPRQNAGRAPGLWQRLKISFQAPRFDGSGRKTENARILRAELNGVTIHENLELFGPTRGGIGNNEAATGPLRLQGDHGAVAFRNIKVRHYSSSRPELKKLTYKIYKGRYEREPDYASLPPEAAGPAGTSRLLTSNLNEKARHFLVRYTGTIWVKEAGEYTFRLNPISGAALLRVNKQEAIPMSDRNSSGTVQLPAGELPFELVYAKTADSGNPAFTLLLSGAEMREFLLSDKEVGQSAGPDPILVDAQERPVLRSFIDLPGRYRVTHAVSVGSPTQLHYTFDMDFGTIVQLWRGNFLDATPMWHDRGDGSSRALGSVQHFGKPALTLAKLASEQTPWATDTAGTHFRQKGYSLNQQSEPTFKYLLYGAHVQDAVRVIEQGKGLQRELTIQNNTPGLYARVVEGARIEEIGKGLYLVDDKAYYVRLDDTGGAKPVIRAIKGRQELVIPVREKLVYSILF